MDIHTQLAAFERIAGKTSYSCSVRIHIQCDRAFCTATSQERAAMVAKLFAKENCDA